MPATQVSAITELSLRGREFEVALHPLVGSGIELSVDEPNSTLREIEGEREGRRSPAPWPCCPVTPTPSPCCATASANYADAFCINHPGLRFEVARGARLPHCQSALPLGRSEWSSPSSLFSFPLGDQEAVGTPAQCSSAGHGRTLLRHFLPVYLRGTLPPSLPRPSCCSTPTQLRCGGDIVDGLVFLLPSLDSLPLHLPSSARLQVVLLDRGRKREWPIRKRTIMAAY